MIKNLFFLTFFMFSYIVFSQCDINEQQSSMIADPDGAYSMQIIEGEVSLAPLVEGYDTLTAFPNALTGELYETVVGIRIPTDTSFVYDLGSGPQLFENVQINSIGINSVEGIPMGFSWECVGGPADPSICTWSGGDYGCIRFFSDGIVDAGLAGSGIQGYPLNVLLDVDASYELFGIPVPITLTVDDLLNYYVLVIEEGNNSSNGEILDVRNFAVIAGFPNPAIDNFIIQYGNDIVSEIDFRVYDMLGNLVFSKYYNSIIGYNEIVFDTSKLFSGIYTLTLSNNSELITERIIVK
jgi:hypothetical protein